MRRLRSVILLIAALLMPVLLAAQPYPSRAITIISPYPPGATNDILARLVAPKLNEAFGQPVVVENRTGASGNIGTALAARAAPDGYTIMIGNDATHATNVFLYKDIGFDPVTSFAPITLAARNVIGIALHPSVPVDDVKGLIAFARANPAKLSFGSSGTGSPHHLAGELLQQRADIKLTHVPYRGGGQAVIDLLGGHLPMMFASLAAVMQYRDAGKVKVLAVVERERYALLRDIPTVGETVPGFEMSSWLGVFAPAGTPAPIVDQLNRAIVAAMRSDDIRGKLDPQGLEIIGSTPADFAAVIREDLDRRREIIRTAGIQPE
ncbi:MAG: tripartite tricarboxylate transporter substrate binding protein [Alphaproteobacteria bacterium]|nr:tripartite tricarboxylate transporter substrate binding protein [Alphaproteobacteria bacterium]